MRKSIVILLTAVSLIFSSVGVYAYVPPFPDSRRTNAPDGKPYPLEHVVRLFQTSINSLPHLLAIYLDSGEILLVQEIQDTLVSTSGYVNILGKSIGNDLQKEVFAKVLSGSQKLKENVERNLKAINDFRRAKRAFEQRSSKLISWMDTEAESVFQANYPDKKDGDTLKITRDIKLGAMKAVFLSRVAPCPSSADNRRKKTGEIWEATIKQALQLPTAAVSPLEKETAAVLISALNNVKQLADGLAARSDELNQSWDQTLTAVESLENLVSPLCQTSAKTAAPAKSGQ